jgi:hypothetical protein
MFKSYYYIFIFGVILVGLFIYYISKAAKELENVDNFLINLFPAVPSNDNIEFLKVNLQVAYVTLAVFIIFFLTIICLLIYQVNVIQTVVENIDYQKKLVI